MSTSETTLRVDYSEFTGLWYVRIEGPGLVTTVADTRVDLVMMSAALRLSHLNYNDHWIIRSLANALDEHRARVQPALDVMVKGRK